MLTRVAAAYADVSASSLRLALGLPAQPALDVLAVRAGPVTVELRLLGASHQVIAAGVSETVACLPGEHAPLPPRVERPGYAFASSVEVLAPAAFRARAEAVRAAAAADPLALAGVFPGSPDALTALSCRPAPGGGVEWETAHLYPRTGEAVVTRSRAC
ncbi:MAG TPA: DUF2617 family protein [Solirubrobacteraceae bacterium]|nr:DUF2617 family protein [Solirubrobacteraceae bacterium]